MNNDKHVTHDNSKDREILYSRTVKAGRRIYYIDVKCDRNGDHYIALTESKRIGHAGDPTHQEFEKHKIFLYREDMLRFTEALAEATRYVEEQDGASYLSDWNGPSAHYRASGNSVTEDDRGEDEASEPESDDYRFDLEF